MANWINCHRHSALIFWVLSFALSFPCCNPLKIFFFVNTILYIYIHIYIYFTHIYVKCVESQLFSNDKIVFLPVSALKFYGVSCALRRTACSLWVLVMCRRAARAGGSHFLEGGHRQTASVVSALGHGRAPWVRLRDCGSVG